MKNEAFSDVLLETRPPAQPMGPGQFPEVKPREICLMFSGGVDSTATAISLADYYDRVHLVTYKNGYGHYYHHRTHKRVRELNEKLGGRFTYSLISTKDYFDQILVNSILKDYKEYRSGFIWFMGCKMAMHMRSTIYCLENGIRYMTDGSNLDTEEMVEQMLMSLSLIYHFYDSMTVEFGTPVYDVRRAASKELIRELDLNMGIEVMDRHLCIQPTCLAGELYYMPYLLFNKKVKHDEGEVAQFIQEKGQICNKIIEEYFRNKGMDLGELLDDRKRQIAEQGPREELLAEAS
jgi:hypothetical protein